MDENLTQRQTAILRFIVTFIRREGGAPSVREIMKGSGLASTGATSYQMQELARKGFVKLSGRFRDISVVVNPFDESPVAPGTLILKEAAFGAPAGPAKSLPELVEGTCVIDQRFFKRKREGELYVIRVTGDSMTGAGIDSGDWVLVKPQETANSGDLVIAAIDNEYTLKRFKLDKGDVVLEPANPAHKPIRILKDKPRDFRILGKVIKAIKDFE